MRKLLIILVTALASNCLAQHSHQDTLRGTITPERAWWNVLKYDITVEPDFATKSISGKNIITAQAVADGTRMQIDMQQPMQITSVTCKGKTLPSVRNENVYYVDLPAPVKKGNTVVLELSYSGIPREAVHPPWDGGWIWKKDKSGNPWMSVACQILGGSSWYPCKDHQSDEPDSATLTIIAPAGLIGVGNGRLVSQKMQGTKTAYRWAVTNPINNYNIVPYIGKYVNWSETYAGEKGRLDLSYWALAENEEKARKQFTQVIPMLKCFEHWFGPYPFYEDGYKLVESPHLGMEHQSAVAYGNKYMNGYMGQDLSGTGWGKKWDFIIIHESGHEWFGNNITTNDVADMWVHEGFTNYSEALYTECLFGKAAGSEYCIGLRKNIQNDIPLIGPYGVNEEGSGDMYYKGANLIHMIRAIMNDDEKFRSLLRGLNKEFYHQTVTTAQIEHYINSASGKNLDKVFDQYLRTRQIPTFEYKIADSTLSYRWADCIDGFDMPLKISAGEDRWLLPTTQWQTIEVKDANIIVDPNFYIGTSKK